MLNENDCDMILMSSIQSIPLNDTLLKTNSNIDLNNSKTITNLLKTKTKEYFVVKNSKNTSSDIWHKFGFPARKHDQNSDKHDVIPNFTSCFKCFQTYRFTDASTSSMRDHKCPQENFKDQKQITNFIASSSSSSSRLTTVSKTIKQKKENLKRLFVRWIVTGIRPFQIVSDSGLVDIIQECLDIGKVFFFFCF